MRRSPVKPRIPIPGRLAWISCFVLMISTGCNPTDPRLDDLRVTGSVTDAAGLPIPGANVTLVRTPCAEGCAAQMRGRDVTGADARFEIVVERNDDEQNAWDLVCHEFTLSVDAAGYAPIVGNHSAWRGPFCASGEAENIEFRLDPA